MIGVIDYRTGNSRSVMYALRHLDVPARLVATPAECHDVTRFVLPGVGSAGVTMTSLRDAGWVSYLDTRVRADGLPFLGICVGLQVLFEASEEQDARCLGWFSGRVHRLDGRRGRVPHMGWNTVRPRTAHRIAAAVPPDSHFYFVNSYVAAPTEPGIVAGETEYGEVFASIVAEGNVMATQFHTEKSGPLGLRLLGTFATLDRDELCSPTG